jgi:hypothetical protein
MLTMAKDKKGFVLYADQIEIFNQLPDEISGKLIKHIFDYVNDKNPTTDDIIINVAFASIKTQLKRDLKKYESICDRNKINGSKGGRPIKPKKPTGLSGNPNKPKKPDIDNDIDNDIDKEKRVSRKFTPPTIIEIKDYCTERKNRVDPNKFYNHYESNGWLVGKNKMKNWKAAVRNWENNNFASDTNKIPKYKAL